jgi:uncharacterized membrane protein
MSSALESQLSRWVEARIIEPVIADRIRNFEASRTARADNVRWQSVLALSFGALMLIAGILLFVAAHWDNMSPTERFLSVLAMVAAFHVAGAFAESRFPNMAMALHGVGTGALGAGIFLAGQIFNLEEHWPGGIMLWALGACIAWALRRDWVQAAYVFLLVPGWLASEWTDATARIPEAARICAAGILLLAIVYLLAPAEGRATPIRRLLMWIGGIAIVPSALTLCFLVGEGHYYWQFTPDFALRLQIIGWAVAIGLPLLLGYLLKTDRFWMVGTGAVWTIMLCTIPLQEIGSGFLHWLWRSIGFYLLGVIGSMALIWAGMFEKRKERINLGVAGVAVSVFAFYFSSVMDKLGRSFSLIGLGMLFLLGGWMLEKTRRKLVQHMAAGGAQ